MARKKRQLPKIPLIAISLAAIAGVILFFVLSLLPAPEPAEGGAPLFEEKGAAAKCADHRDNDGDGFCDFNYSGAYCSGGARVGDPDCESRRDNSEACAPSAEVCDWKDNDCDSLVDEDNACINAEFNGCFELFSGRNNVSADRVNVVFVGVKYPGVSALAEDARKSI